MSIEMLADECIERLSLRDEAYLEACKDRWYRSQEAGCDQGESAVRAWVNKHWRGFFRARWVEHMEGSRFWIELDREEFGLLKRHDLESARYLLDEILDQIRCGCENLDILREARKSKTKEERETIFQLLLLININAHRLRCTFCNLKNEFELTPVCV